MPIIYICAKYFHKLPYLGTKMKEAWSELFWNTPLRTFVEIFIEISFGFFLHSQNIKFLTPSGIVATTVMFIAGVFVLVFPFIVLNVVCKPSNYAKSKTFNKKYGALTEDVYKKKKLYEKAYYAMFVFSRLILTGTIVMLYQYPLFQLIIIFVSQVLMIAYLMKYRPFRSELLEVIVVSDEFTIIIELILLYFLHKHQDNIDKRAKIGNLTVFIIVHRYGSCWSHCFKSLKKPRDHCLFVNSKIVSHI